MTRALDWASGEGWNDVFRDKGEPWDRYGSSEAYRQRHLMDGLTALASVLTRRGPR